MITHIIMQQSLKAQIGEKSQSEFYFSIEAKFQLFLLLATHFITTPQMTNKTEVILCINKICKQTLIIKY